MNGSHVYCNMIYPTTDTKQKCIRCGAGSDDMMNTFGKVRERIIYVNSWGNIVICEECMDRLALQVAHHNEAE